MNISRIDSYGVAKGTVFIALSYVLVAHMLPAILGLWRETNTIHALVVTPAMRAEVVASLAHLVTREYWSEAKGKKLAAFLQEAERGGRYRLATTPQQLAEVLTEDMHNVTGDQHTKVAFSPAEVPDVGARSIDMPPSDETSLLTWPIDRLGRSLAQFGIADVSVSEAGIGYIKLTYFYRPFLASEKYAAALKTVRDSRALVIDLREARGGYASSAALLASYFFDQPTHLSDIEAPRRGEVEHLWTSAYVDGPRYGATKQVTILTSRNTFSGGEDFAYSMQAAQRATVVGEPTRGGAHPTERFRVGRHFIANVPVSQSINAVTHANWEGNGVQPDMLVPAGSALRVATAGLLRKPPAATISVRAAD